MQLLLWMLLLGGVAFVLNYLRMVYFIVICKHTRYNVASESYWRIIYWYIYLYLLILRKGDVLRLIFWIFLQRSTRALFVLSCCFFFLKKVYLHSVLWDRLLCICFGLRLSSLLLYTLKMTALVSIQILLLVIWLLYHLHSKWLCVIHSFSFHCWWLLTVNERLLRLHVFTLAVRNRNSGHLDFWVSGGGGDDFGTCDREILKLIHRSYCNLPEQDPN